MHLLYFLFNYFFKEMRWQNHFSLSFFSLINNYLIVKIIILLTFVIQVCVHKNKTDECNFVVVTTKFRMWNMMWFHFRDKNNRGNMGPDLVILLLLLLFLRWSTFQQYFEKVCDNKNFKRRKCEIIKVNFCNFHLVLINYRELTLFVFRYWINNFKTLF